jgi:hypothetical protein
LALKSAENSAEMAENVRFFMGKNPFFMGKPRFFAVFFAIWRFFCFFWMVFYINPNFVCNFRFSDLKMPKTQKKKALKYLKNTQKHLKNTQKRQKKRQKTQSRPPKITPFSLNRIQTLRIRIFRRENGAFFPINSEKIAPSGAFFSPLALKKGPKKKKIGCGASKKPQFGGEIPLFFAVLREKTGFAVEFEAKMPENLAFSVETGAKTAKNAKNPLENGDLIEGNVHFSLKFAENAGKRPILAQFPVKIAFFDAKSAKKAQKSDEMDDFSYKNAPEWAKNPENLTEIGWESVKSPVFVGFGEIDFDLE